MFLRTLERDYQVPTLEIHRECDFSTEVTQILDQGLFGKGVKL